MTTEGVMPPPAGRSASDERPDRIAAQCAAAFRRYIDAPDESALLGAYDLGRRALSDGLGILDMARVLSSVAEVVAELRASRDQRELVRAAEAFLVETLSPFEMAHRGYREANTVLRRMNDLLEAQARRIAGSLHDEASELLTPLHLALAEVATHATPDLSGDLERIRTLLTRVEERLRTLAHELRPPALDHFGLARAVELLAEVTSLRFGIAIKVHVDIARPLPATVEATIYRVVQESLNNVVKHARASLVTVTMVLEPGRLVCSVGDDGVGFARGSSAGADRAGIGLSGLQERVAALGGTLHAGPNEDGRGTIVSIGIPLEA